VNKGNLCLGFDFGRLLATWARDRHEWLGLGKFMHESTALLSGDRFQGHFASILRSPKEQSTLVYAIMLPGQKSGFRAGSRPDSNRETIKVGPPAGPLPAGVLMLSRSRLESGRNPARKPDFRPGRNIA
jgi:hypothetical protein